MSCLILEALFFTFLLLLDETALTDYHPAALPNRQFLHMYMHVSMCAHASLHEIRQLLQVSFYNDDFCRCLENRFIFSKLTNWKMEINAVERNNGTGRSTDAGRIVFLRRKNTVKYLRWQLFILASCLKSSHSNQWRQNTCRLQQNVLESYFGCYPVACTPARPLLKLLKILYL